MKGTVVILLIMCVRSLSMFQDEQKKLLKAQKEKKGEMCFL